MKINFNILFPLESSGRELEYKCLLASKFANMGHHCYIGEKAEIYKLFNIIKPIIYFDKGYHKDVSEKIYEILKKKNHYIISLDEEGAVDYSDGRTLLTRYPLKFFSIADLIFLWGTNQYNFLKKNLKNADLSKVVVSGHPRFELLKYNLNNFNQYEYNFINKNFNDHILITSNCSLGNNIKGKEFVIQNYKSRIININEIIEADKKKIRYLVEFAIELSKRIKKPIVFRPHQEENLEFYKKKFKNFKNIYVICEYSSISWILNCNLLVHPDCTTAVEASILNKKVISLLPNIEDKYITEIPYKLSINYNNPQKLANDISKGKINEIRSDLNNIKNQSFSMNLSSIEIILNSVSNLISRSNIKNKKFIKKYDIYYLKIYYFFKTIIKIFRNKKQNQFAYQKRKNFNLNNIKLILKSLNISKNDNEILKINNGLFMIKSKKIKEL